MFSWPPNNTSPRGNDQHLGQPRTQPSLTDRPHAKKNFRSSQGARVVASVQISRGDILQPPLDPRFFWNTPRCFLRGINASSHAEEEDGLFLRPGGTKNRISVMRSETAKYIGPFTYVLTTVSWTFFIKASGEAGFFSSFSRLPVASAYHISKY